MWGCRIADINDSEAAVEACHKAGIGLIAMKTQAEDQMIETEQDKKLADEFLKRGFTPGQAKIKIVLEGGRISSACVGMKNVAELRSNVAAVLDETKLTRQDEKVFAEFMIKCRYR